MLKNVKIIEIGPSLDMPPAGQSFTTYGPMLNESGTIKAHNLVSF